MTSSGGTEFSTEHRPTERQFEKDGQRIQGLEARVTVLEEALRGIKWQAGSTPSKQVLGSIVRRAQEALDE